MSNAHSPAKKASSIFSISSVATVLMTLYVAIAVSNLYGLMFPLARIDLSKYSYPRDFVHNLWGKNDGASLHMKVYLSTNSRFTLSFLKSEDFHTEPAIDEDDGKVRAASGNILTSPHVLLWDQKLDLHPSLSMSFLLTNLEDHSEECVTDASYQHAVDWLDRAERIFKAERDGEAGILSALSAASGHGIESTSFLLTLYESLARRTRSLLEYLSVIGKKSVVDDDDKENYGFLGRTRFTISPTSPIWSAVQANSTLFVHVLVIRTSGVHVWPPRSIHEVEQALQRASSTHSLLMGQVNMIKYDVPNHIGKPRRFIYRDLVYFWNRYMKGSREMPPWVMAVHKPEEYAAYQQVLDFKQRGMGYPYWKPEVSIKYVTDEDSYPTDYAHQSGMPWVELHGSKLTSEHQTGFAFTPALHVDEMGMTSEKYIPLNKTVTALPLRISFDRSDIVHKTVSTTATAGGMSPARWRLLKQLSAAIEKQKEIGFDESDIDDLKRLVADTNVTLLAITMLASALHLLFEFLTFKSEVSFWKQNKVLIGLSVRSLFLDFFGQTIILFYLIEQESSLLTTIPSAIGCLIALWKCKRAAGLQFVKSTRGGLDTVSWWNWLPRKLTGYELRATRLEESLQRSDNDKNTSNLVKAQDKLMAMTIESDRLATKYLGAVLIPLAAGYTLHSLIYNEHRSWYSWMITSSASAVYALGFVLMTPQLFLNWKLKSVAHLPWRVLVYKSLNTFIDDLFSFIIRMPTMARISCFRDDIVFFVYLYQRFLYPVDASRPVEGGGDGDSLEKKEDSATQKKKNR